MALRLCFFDTHEVTKIIPPKALQNLKEGAKLYLLAERTEPKWRNIFPRNIQYRARLKTSSFSALWDFWKKFSPKGPPFMMICDRMDKKSWSVFFRHCETSRKFFNVSKRIPSNVSECPPSFFCFSLQQNGCSSDWKIPPRLERFRMIW